jgi:hypothetical protein
VEVTFGVSGDQFVLGTSRERIRDALQVRSGKVGNILSSPGWNGLGLAPPGSVQAVAYRDLGELRGEAQRGLQALSLVSALVPDGAAGPSLSKRLLLLLPRLAPVAGALGFLDQGGFYLSREGSGFRGEIILTVRPDTPRAEPAPASPEKADPEKKRKF